MRHSEIYNLKWPERLPGDGSTAFLPTPRDTRNSTPITFAALAALDRKLNFATHGYAPPKRPYNKRKLQEIEEDPRPAKKLKPVAPTSTGKPRGRPPKKNRVGMSTNAQLILKVSAGAAKASAKPVAAAKGKETERVAEEESSRRSGRTRVPSLKLRETETPNSRLPSRSRSRLARPVTPPPSSSSTGSALSGLESEGLAELPQTPVKKRPEGEEVESPKVPTPKSLAVAAQPRESNGRFGRKNAKKPMAFAVGGRKNRAKRVLKGNFRTKVKTSGKSDDSEWESADEGAPRSPVLEVVDVEVTMEESAALKRSAREMAEEEEEEEPSLKKIRMEEEEEDQEEQDASDSGEETVYFRPSLLTGAKPGIGLLRAPNPVSFARRNWATARADPISRAAEDARTTDEETDLPVTPEPVPVVEYHPETDSADEDAEPPPIVAPAPFVGKLTLKPSPINLSRRRWAPPPPRFPIEKQEDDSPIEKLPSADRPDASTNPEGYWSDEEEWGWPWTESEDGGEEEFPRVEYRAPMNIPESGTRRAPVKGLTTTHSSPRAEHSVDNLGKGPPSDSSVLSKVASKSPSMNWKRTVLLQRP